METNITYELKKEIYNYHTDLHKNDRGMGGSIHKRVRERFNLPSDTISSIIQEMKGKEAIAENEELKARCETYKKDYDSMVAEVLRLSGENSELLEALKSARDVLAMASLIDKTATCGNESDKIDSILYKYAPNKL
jgi:predicted nuclease with TOPRIM domain